MNIRERITDRLAWIMYHYDLDRGAYAQELRKIFDLA